MFGFKKWRRKRLSSRPFPRDWLAIIESNVPIYNKLPPADKAELQRHIFIFIGEKQFEGCGGLQITDEIKVTIAAQACILLLHRQADYYPGLYSVLVYPQAYVARERKHLACGVVAEGPEVRLGESWHRGSVVLSWDDVRRSAADMHDGHNIVFHEFAHQLDDSGGKRDSTPVLQKRSNYIAWARILQRDFQKLRSDIGSRRPTILDGYGATNQAEFFAVATECFFEKPKQLQKYYPELYDELKLFYQQDPAKFFQK